jgi:hypothetical protein
MWAYLLRVAICVIVLLAICLAANRAHAEGWLTRHAKEYNCAWVARQLRYQTPEQLEAKARKWHVPEELIEQAKACPR